MAKGGVGIQVEGLAALQKQIGAIGQTVIAQVDAEMSAVGDDYVDRAVNDAPRDQGLIANTITKIKHGVMNYEIACEAPYAAYMEFGTKSRFQAIPGIDASQFRAKATPKNGKGFFLAIYEWVKRKGIADRFSTKTKKRVRNKNDEKRILGVAYAIFKSILKNGVHPHPFFFKQIPVALSQLTQALNRIKIR